MILFRHTLRAGLVLLLTFPLAPQPVGRKASPNLSSLVTLVSEELHPQQAMTFMREVYGNDRFFTFPRFEKTAAYIRRVMNEAGLTDVEIVRPPADGVTQVGYWTMPVAWDAKSAQVTILKSGIPVEFRTLVDYPQVPASLGMWSGATPKEGVEAEIVEVGKADLRAGASLNLRGKLALTDQNPANVKWQLVKAGALGAINTFTENPRLEDGRQWINAWGDSGWAYTKNSTPLLSFSITPRQAAFVRELLSLGPVRVRAVVDSRYYEGTYPYVTGVIRGAGSGEVLTLGHTSEQGAQDNATGVAATLDALATLNRLIVNGKLPRPRRSIRILSMGEMYGSMHYVANHPERVRETVAAMCVDTPAASYDLAGTEYTFYMNPHVSKDFTDAFIMKIAREYFPRVGRPWREKEFTTGTDTYLAEPMVGIPTVWGYSGSGVETHHNSEDTPDRVDWRSLRDIATVDAAFLYFLANADETEAFWLAGLSETRGYRQILKASERASDGIASSGSREQVGRALTGANEAIEYALGRESQSVLSVLRLITDARRQAARARLQPALKRLREFSDQQNVRLRATAEARLRELKIAAAITTGPEAHPRDAESERIVVHRKRFGTIPLDDLPHEQWEGQPSGAWAAVPTIALYWCDGRRNLAEVARLTRLELGPTSFDFVRYFQFLKKHGYVDFVE